MATSKVAICNSALVRCGADRIVSLTEDSRQAKLCNEQYEKIKKMLLRAHPWNFAIKRASLAASVTPPAFGYDNSFPVPADFVRALHVNEDLYPWQKEGQAILTNADTCELEFIADVAEGYFDASFDELFAALMAYNICGDLTTAPTLRQTIYNEYRDLLREARLFDAQESTATPVRTTTFIRSRR